MLVAPGLIGPGGAVQWLTRDYVVCLLRAVGAFIPSPLPTAGWVQSWNMEAGVNAERVTKDTGYSLKLKRSKQQLNAITRRADKFINGNLTFAADHETESGVVWLVLRWKDCTPPPPMWGVHVGEMFHNIRSALDQLMFVLVRDNSNEPGKHTQFPIYNGELEWINNIEQRDVTTRGLPPTEGVSDEILAILKQVQPYHVAHKKRMEETLLPLLRMSNTDKHRTLHVAQVSARKPEKLFFQPPGFAKVTKKRVAPEWQTVEDDAEIARVQYQVIKKPRKDPEMAVRIQGVSQIVAPR
jgi:hypothetical protein